MDNYSVKHKTIHQKINETEISRFNWNKNIGSQSLPIMLNHLF